MLNNRCGASSIQKFLSIVLLEATSCPLPCGVTSVGAGGSLMGIFFFFFLFFSLSSPKHYNLDLFVGGISTSFIILLIFMFCFLVFLYINFISFHFQLSISIYQILYFLILFLFF